MSKGGKEKRDHMARCAVSDETWAAFKVAAHRRHVTVSEYLGTLMQREVTRLAALAAREESLSVQDATAALDEVRSLTGDLARIADRLEWAAQIRERGPAPVTAPPTTDELNAMTDDELIALGKPAPKTEPLAGDWFRR